MKQFLKDEISRGNTTNLGRSLSEAMANNIIAATDFLENPKNFNERVYCIINDISRQPKDVYGKNARFININLGYSYKISSAVDELRLALDSLKKRRKNLDRQMVKSLSDSSLRKVIEFKNRNLKKNCHLYDKNAVEGEDYVVCPITNMRKAMIESKYIVNVLGMTVEEFDELYPNIQKVSQRRMTNIKNGLKEIDPITGLPKYKIGMLKSKQTLSRVGPDGKTGYKRKGEKTRNTHMSKIDEYGRTGYRRQADYRLTTVLPNGLTIEQNAHLKQRDKLIANNKTGTGGASKMSKKVLSPIIEFLNQNNIKYYFDNLEYGIKDTDTNQYYFWDLTIPTFKMAIEYQSSAWHADPTLDEDQWKSWKTPKGKHRTAQEVLEYDYNKARSLYKHREFVTYYVWQRSQDNDVKELLCLLKTMIMKY